MLSFLYSPTLTSIHDYWKIIALTRWTFVGKVMSLLFNMLSTLVIVFLARCKHLLISWLRSPLKWFWSPPKNKACHCFHYFPIYLPWNDGTRWHNSFLNVEFKPFSLSSFTFIKRLFSSSLLSAIRVMSSAYLRLLILIIRILILPGYSPGSLDSSLCFIQPSISHDVVYL